MRAIFLINDVLRMVSEIILSEPVGVRLRGLLRVLEGMGSAFGEWF